MELSKMKHFEIDGISFWFDKEENKNIKQKSMLKNIQSVTNADILKSAKKT